MKKSLVALACLLRRPKYRGRKNHNLPIKFDRKENPFRGVFFIDTLTMFLYTWDYKKGVIFMISFTYEDNIAVNWDGDKTFNITRDRVIIDSFVEQETPTLEKANIIADEYIQESLQDEMLRDADTMQDQDDEMEFQFRSPDLFKM